MKLNTKIEISLIGIILLSAAVATLAVATSRLVNSIDSDGEAGSSDWSLDEKEYALI